MKKQIATLSLALAMISGGAAIARPFVYVASFAHGAGATKCLDSAEQALKKLGFTENTERDYDPKVNDKVGRVYGSHTDSSTRAVIYCDQKDVITSLAVSGLDADTTWELYASYTTPDGERYSRQVNTRMRLVLAQEIM